MQYRHSTTGVGKCLSPSANVCGELAAVAENKINEKYDQYIPEELLCSEFASRYLDQEGALKTAKKLLGI